MGTVAPRARRLSRLQIALLVGGALLLLLLLVAILSGGNGSGSAAEEASADLQGTPFLGLAVLAFFAGVLGFVSPCTLPLLPAYFAITFQAERRRVLVMTIAFMAGLAVTFAIFGALAGILGRALSAVGLSKFDLARLGGLVVIFFGLMSLSGKGFTGLQSGATRNASLWGSFVFGATFGLGWTSCTGPVLGAITTLAINANFGVMEGQLAQWAPILGSILLLTVFAMGLGVPLIVVSTFFGRADRDSLLWRILRGKGWEVKLFGKTLYLHSTTMVSGFLFIALGILMVSGRLTLLNNLVPDDLALCVTEIFAGVEEWLVSRLGG
jgi:cytochrome c-type biogenesis protein